MQALQLPSRASKPFVPGRMKRRAQTLSLFVALTAYLTFVGQNTLQVAGSKAAHFEKFDSSPTNATDSAGGRGKLCSPSATNSTCIDGGHRNESHETQSGEGPSDAQGTSSAASRASSTPASITVTSPANGTLGRNGKVPTSAGHGPTTGSQEITTSHNIDTKPRSQTASPAASRSATTFISGSISSRGTLAVTTEEASTSTRASTQPESHSTTEDSVVGTPATHASLTSGHPASVAGRIRGLLSFNYRCRPSTNASCKVIMRVCQALPWCTTCSKTQFDSFLSNCAHEEDSWLGSLEVTMDEISGAIVDHKYSSFSPDEIQADIPVVILLGSCASGLASSEYLQYSECLDNLTYLMVPGLGEPGSSVQYCVATATNRMSCYMQAVEFVEKNTSRLVLDVEARQSESYMEFYHLYEASAQWNINGGPVTFSIQSLEFGNAHQATCQGYTDHHRRKGFQLAIAIGCSTAGICLVAGAIIAVGCVYRRRRCKRAVLRRYLSNATADSDFSAGSMNQYISLSPVDEGDDGSFDLPDVMHILSHNE